MSMAHETVLLQEAVAALSIRPDGCYIDGTFGRGGHSRLILQQLGPQGRLLVFDKDPQAVAVAQELAAADARVIVAADSFAGVGAVLQQQAIPAVDGVLLDLGVSSPQLDQAERGFSFMRDGELDMRMDPERGQSAAEWLAVASEQEIARVLKDFGEERFAKRMARAIVTERQQAPITRTAQLAEIVKAANPAWEKGKHPATRAFQGIRIFINNELDDLQQGLQAFLDVLAVGGRLVVISFHSLEDRMVKQFMRRQARGDQLPASIPVTDAQLNRRLKLIGKAQKPSAEEIAVNVRSRSAVMRVAEKIA